MTQHDDEFARFLRRSLHEAAGSLAIGDDGLEKIRDRLAEVRRAEVRRAAAADHGGSHALSMAGSRAVLLGVSLAVQEHW